MTTLPKLTSSLIAVALAAALPAVALTNAAPATAQNSNALNEAVGALRAISTMRANFSQTDRNGRTVTGVLTLKRPGKIRFEYAKGVNMLLVSDGKALTFIDYDVKQPPQRWPIGNSPLGALLNPDKDVTKYARLLPTTNPDVVSVEVKDPRKPEYGKMTFIFVRNAAAPGGLELTSWVALDAQNARTTVRLTNQQYGVAVPDGTFTYRDPRASVGRPH